MMKFLQRLGRSLMLPVACLPVGGILMGIGYWIDSDGWGANNVVAAFLLAAGGVLLNNLPLLFAIGVGVGMSKDQDGTAGLAGLMSWLTFTTLLSPNVVAQLTKAEANMAFDKIENAFIGIIAGLIGAFAYNKFKGTKLPTALAFFSGKRSVAIITVCLSTLVSIPLFFIWPVVYNALVTFGKGISQLGALGAGLYGFFNRLLIPTGLHHALNQVFWSDLAGITDIGKFWGVTEGGVLGETGMYMAGFFPVMMFGIPAGCLAMYQTAKTKKKKIAASLLGAAALASFFTGVTEPFEFAFMFLAPGLYLVHAVLTGVFVGVVALLPARAGFNFSAGLVDYILSFKAPFAQNPWMLLLLGLAAAVIYYSIFRFAIVKFNLKTPGREDDEDNEEEMKAVLKNDNYSEVAATVLEGLGGKENVKSVDNCITRLRIEVNDYTAVDEKKIKSAGVAGIIRPSKTSVQVVIGTQVQHVADEMKKMI